MSIRGITLSLPFAAFFAPLLAAATVRPPCAATEALRCGMQTTCLATSSRTNAFRGASLLAIAGQDTAAAIATTVAAMTLESKYSSPLPSEAGRHLPKWTLTRKR
jgi:hypothetical protein